MSEKFTSSSMVLFVKVSTKMHIPPPTARPLTPAAKVMAHMERCQLSAHAVISPQADSTSQATADSPMAAACCSMVAACCTSTREGRCSTCRPEPTPPRTTHPL